MKWREAFHNLSPDKQKQLAMVSLSFELDVLGMDANAISYSEERREFYCPHSGSTHARSPGKYLECNWCGSSSVFHHEMTKCPECNESDFVVVTES